MSEKVLTIQQVEFIAHRLAKKFMQWNGPIPDFSTRFPNVLESYLSTPFQTFDGKDLFRGLIEKAAILFYLIIKNHPFQNGNKRIAVTALIVFLAHNRKWLEVDNQILYNFAVWIAASPPDFKEQALSSINKFIRINLIQL